MGKQLRVAFNRKDLVLFFGFTFLFSWLVWGGMLLLKPAEQLFLPLLLLGAFGPFVTAAYLMRRQGKAVQKDFWRRFVNFRQIRAKDYAIILLLFPGILVIGYTLYFLAGGALPSADLYFGGITGIGDVLILLAIMLLGGPLSEEPGWRGYGQEPLQQKLGKVNASLLIGVLWVLWHLPLFFIEGTSQHAKGFGPAFWSWALQLILISFLFTWIYNRTNRSILAAVLLHLMANFAYPLNLDATGEVVFSVVRVLVVFPLILQWLKEEKQVFPEQNNPEERELSV